jgi:hypothetical protein
MAWRRILPVYGVGMAIVTICCVVFVSYRYWRVSAERSKPVLERAFRSVLVDEQSEKREAIAYAVGFWLVAAVVMGIGLLPFSKEKSEAAYEGHVIRVRNGWDGARLFVDGDLQDEGEGLSFRRVNLQGSIKSGQGEGKRIRASLSCDMLIPRCLIFVDDRVVFRG